MSTQPSHKFFDRTFILDFLERKPGLKDLLYSAAIEDRKDIMLGILLLNQHEAFNLKRMLSEFITFVDEHEEKCPDLYRVALQEYHEARNNPALRCSMARIRYCPTITDLMVDEISEVLTMPGKVRELFVDLC